VTKLDMTARRLRIGIVGMGNAGQAFAPAIQTHPGFEWVAFAEPAEAPKAACESRYGVRGYASLHDMLGHPELDVVCIASPTEHHTAQALDVIASGKHVLVEKPMAVSLEDARAMVAAAREAAVVLLIGHSHSYDAPIKRMRELIASGAVGRVRMAHTWCYTDWMYRPRRADELDLSLGGGVTFRQGAHQFDILRLLCGGAARSVRARTFDWDPDRRSIGAHVAFIDFEDGAAATAVYNGYGGFQSVDLCQGISEWGLVQPKMGGSVGRRRAPLDPAAELRAKQARAGTAIPGQAPHQPFFGLTLVSCERGDIRQSPDGLYVYAEGEQHEIPVPLDRSPRDLVLDELHEAIVGRSPPVHDGRWGLGNLELCLAAIASSDRCEDVKLREQSAVRA
jgi:phthalate 4,5-cis-dihydrodiol dehydrogenase